MNQKNTVRLILVLLLSLIILLKISDSYDLISGFIVFILLIFDLFESNHVNNTKSELIYYTSWILIVAITFSVRGNDILPFTPMFITLMIKSAVVVMYIIKYKSMRVTRTVLSKISLITLAAYIIELIINSTHGLGSIMVFWIEISSLELICILLIKKRRVGYVSSLLTDIWENQRQS